MEKACEQNRFMNKLDGKPDMVSSITVTTDTALFMLCTSLCYVCMLGLHHRRSRGLC